MNAPPRINDPESPAGTRIGQVLVIVGLVLLYGVGGYYLVVHVFQDPEAEWFLKFGLPAVVVGLTLLFFVVLKQRMKAARTDRYTDIVDEPEADSHILVVTSPTIPGKKITRTLGLASGNTIRARHIGKDIIALLRNVVGGEVTEYAQLLAESREQALDRMKAKAEKLGGNAVISLQFQTSVIMGGAAEMMAYGTAVVVKDD